MTCSQTIRAGVMGWPVSHSLSPRVHGYWLSKYNINGTYEQLAVEPADLKARLRALAADGFAGVNITVPHKENALAIVDTVDQNATRIGAVNTVVVNADGTLAGRNTDGFGFIENLRAGCPDFSPAKGAAVILGAGGAARAIVVALIDAGVPDIKIVNRTHDKAVQLAASLGGTAVLWDQRDDALAGAGLLVNTTTLGMVGKPALEISLDKLPTSAVVNDIVYAPLETGLLAGARQRGNRVVDGLGMLLHQARPGFAAWFGVEPVVSDALRAYVLDREATTG